jgi:RNA polymerase sigma-70 factor (ECF subfamily)
VATRLEEVRDGGGRGTYADLDDRFLVLDFQAGNANRAFEEIHRRYSGLARHVCQNILRNAEDADEATQETMLRVYQGLPRFNGRYMVQPWVARIATNVCLDIVRARQRRPVADLPIDHAHETAIELEDRAPEMVVERKLERARVKAALDALSPNHRSALVLREFEGRSHEEIALALDITPQQAKALIHRAKAAFRRVWDAERRGVAAIVPILLAPFRLPDALRRLIGSAGEAAATTGGAAASPIVSTTVVNTGERVAAAAVAIAMATTVSVGAVTLRDRIGKDREPIRDREPKAVVVSSPATPVSEKDDPKLVVVEPAHKPTRERDAEPKRRADAAETKQQVVAPIVEPSDTPDTTATTDSGEPSPSPSPSDTTSPAPPPPAPEWGMQFSMIGKSAQLTQTSSKVKGTAGDEMLFSEAASGTLGVLNPVDVHVRYYGSATGSEGTTMIVLYLDTANGRYTYEGNGTLQALTTPDDGTSAYAFSGAYTLIDSPATDDSRLGKKLARAGTFELDLGFWQDQATLYSVGLSLSAADVSADQTLVPA